jgi:antitoxin MazE
MKAIVRKWGNSAAVRLPASVLQAADLHVDQAVEIHEDAGRIVIEPLKRKGHNLAELVRAISAQNLHEEADFGRRTGKEAW